MTSTKSYSSKSLEMLESEEGQLNAVYACYGSAAQHGQLLEHALSGLVVSLKNISGRSVSLPDLQAVESSLHKKTLGQLRNDFEKHVTKIDEWVSETLRTAIMSRNYLIHHFFLKRQDSFQTHSGRIGMLKELVEIGKSLEKATDLTNGMRVAVNRILDGDLGERDCSSALFSFEIDVPDSH